MPASLPTSRPARRRPGRRGLRAFTIVEVLVAVFVMALAISTSITTLQSGYRAIDTARNLTLAGQILQSMIEDIRLKQWTDINSMAATTTGSISTFDTTGSFTNFSATAAATLARFTITRTVADVTGQTGLKKIVLTAKWKAIDGHQTSVNYTTYYAQNGLYDYYYP
jgi:uncharacterized protein (TIGR02598 family)